MDKEQMINKMKQHPKRTALLAILLLLFLCNLLSNGDSKDYDNSKDTPYGTATMAALQQEHTDNPTDPAIESPIYMAVMSEINMFMGKGDGKLFATVDMPEKLEIDVHKPATYASKVVIKNITPQQSCLGSANGYMGIDVLKPFGIEQKGSLHLNAGGGSNEKDFWNTIFMTNLTLNMPKKSK